MKRVLIWSVLAASVALTGHTLYADVKTQTRTVLKLEGMMGTFFNRLAGGDKGVTSTIAVKGNRMSTANDTNAQIVDLAEERVYTVDLRRKEYTVETFAEARARIEKAKADAEKQAAGMTAEDKAQVEDAAKQIEFDVDVKETGQRKPLAGHDTREVVLTIAMREKGRTLEEGGGMVVTNTLWLAPKIAALDEVTEFQMKYFRAIYGGMFTGVNVEQMATLAAIMPGLASLRERMATESRKLDGTPLFSTSVMETVKSAEQMAAASAQQASGGGGLSGMMARRVLGNRGQPQQRSVFFTSTHETLSVAPAASADDVSIPATFKEKK
jgi:hypothetical protein